MNMKLNRAILWLEKKIWDLHKKRTVAALILCLISGLGASAFRPETAAQILGVVWMIPVLIAANKTAMSFYNGSLKQILATGGDVTSVLYSKLYYPVLRMEIFLGIYTLSAVVIMAVAHHHPGWLLLRSLICILATPIVMGGTTAASLCLKEPAKTVVNILIVLIFNLFMIAEAMVPAAYAVEVLILAVSAVGVTATVKRVPGEKILSKGGR
jgi:hypothetical protein